MALAGLSAMGGLKLPTKKAPRASTELTGTYDKKTGEYSFEWVSQIVGGPFDTFTGVWHFEGTFKAAKKK